MYVYDAISLQFTKLLNIPEIYDSTPSNAHVQKLHPSIERYPLSEQLAAVDGELSNWNYYRVRQLRTRM